MEYDKIIEKLHNVAFKQNQEVYIIASINGQGNHIGKIKNISLDSDCNIVVVIDIDKESVTE